MPQSSNYTHDHEEKFTCNYPSCGRTVEKFAFTNECGEKFCSSFCRKKREQERRAHVEADSENDSLPEPA